MINNFSVNLYNKNYAHLVLDQGVDGIRMDLRKIGWWGGGRVDPVGSG
jgi:hypothetical protein